MAMGMGHGMAMAWAWPWDIYGIMPAIGANQAGNEHVFYFFQIIHEMCIVISHVHSCEMSVHFSWELTGRMPFCACGRVIDLLE